MNQAWIRTGKAAAIRGYSQDHFRKTFEGIIPSRKLPGGHYRWLESAVRHLAAQAAVMEQSA